MTSLLLLIPPHSSAPKIRPSLRPSSTPPPPFLRPRNGGRTVPILLFSHFSLLVQSSFHRPQINSPFLDRNYRHSWLTAKHLNHVSRRKNPSFHENKYWQLTAHENTLYHPQYWVIFIYLIIFISIEMNRTGTLPPPKI